VQLTQVKIQAARMRFRPKSLFVAFVFLAGVHLSGQTSITPAPKSDEEKEIEKQEQSQRMLGVIPQFGTTDRQHAYPLSAKEKFHLFTKSAFDPVELTVVGGQAAVSQAEDEFPEYGQGAAGYGKRYGATLADEVSSGFFGNFFYPVLLKEDPRYFRLGRSSLHHRSAIRFCRKSIAAAMGVAEAFAGRTFSARSLPEVSRMPTIRRPNADSD
jgi:hypothetical protein